MSQLKQSQESTRCIPPIMFKDYITKDIGIELNIKELKNYTLFECLGKGALGEVYLVKNMTDGKTSALKVIDLSKEGATEKFEKEKENFKLFTKDKKSCVQDYINCHLGVYATDKYGLILMNYFPKDLKSAMSGTSFYEQVIENKSQSLPRFIRWVKELVEAVDYMHKHKIGHGDIKPANILINTLSDTIAITDFDTICIPKKKDLCYPTESTPLYASPDLDLATTPKNIGKAISLDIIQLSDWWATCRIILELWFGVDKMNTLFPVMTIEYYTQLSKDSEVYRNINREISLTTEAMSKKLTSDNKQLFTKEEWEAIHNLLANNVFLLFRKIGSKDPDINEFIKDTFIKNIKNLPEFSGLLKKSQKGGSTDDYYKMKYLKYKMKYLALK